MRTNSPRNIRPKRSKRSFATPNVKVEAVYDEEDEKHLLKVHRLKHGNYKTTSVTPEFTFSADYRKLQESAAMLRGIIGTGARVARGKDDQPVKNFGEAVNWLLKQAEKGIIRQRYKGLGEMTAEPAQPDDHGSVRAPHAARPH